MRLTHMTLLGALLGATCVSSVAFAGDVEVAEHRRLSEEMERLAQRNAWAGVERSFKELIVLQESGEVITYEEWHLGAQAARALGDMSAARDRIAQAVRLEGKEEDIAWLEQIDKNYGPVNLRSVDKESVPTLTIAAMPFAADQRAALEYAQKELAEERTFKGLLPPGQYTFEAGGVVETFAVEAAQLETVTVRLTPSGDGGSGALSYVGPRIDIGAGFTSAGPAVPEKEMPPGFSGIGARAGVGLEVGFKRGFGVMAEVGYHNLVSGSDRQDIAGVPNLADSMHLGYGVLGPTFRLGNVWLSGGGVLAIGVAQASGINELGQVNNQCPYGSEDPDCAWVSSVPEEHREYYPWSGKLTTSGFQASAGFAFMDIGSSLRMGVSGTGGMLLDDTRNYPWGQLAVTIAPVPARSE
ncbi:MAG: hypothetical protein GY913_14010 [Proteobacteria bacterium]|nr:hypothetical protein [Pseudomonadota bacterium]MCP4918023.1 hypothetical protein [Pseudomonadota bacterium]